MQGLFVLESVGVSYMLYLGRDYLGQKINPVLLLRVSHEFVSKTQLSSGSGPIRPISRRSLDDFVGDLPGELNFCPVRAILMYYKRVNSGGLSRDKG